MGLPFNIGGRRFWIVLGGLVGLGLILVLWPFSTSDAGDGLPDRVDFNYHIRPILSNTCYVCHGPDPSTREADLRLDLREHATARREEGGRAIVPGSARRSVLIQRIMAEDPEQRMPPAEMNKVLTPHEVALLSRWIEQGAEYKKHWSLIPPSAPAIPPGPEGASAIDRFILADLDAQGLALAPAASKEALIRRASYVLTGLPPSTEAVQAFVDDHTPDAYEKVVDRLMASPRFGERWARHWMDLTRYAESKGHEFDFTIDGAWHYRDYLIRAFNADVPYNQFMTEHLAGDLLDTPRRHSQEQFNESAIGTAFIGLGEGKHSPVDTRIDEAERIDNIIDVTTKTFQAMTVACARCHDHKFDPIPTTDYYALYGIFESARFTPAPLLSAHDVAQLDSIKTLQAKLRQRLAAGWLDETQGAPVRQAKFISGKRGSKTAFHPHPVPLPSRERGLLDDPNILAKKVGSAAGRSGEESPLLRGVPNPREGGGRRGVLADVQEAAASDTTIAPRVLGDFRDGSFDGWFAYGPAFGEGPAMGLPVFDENGRRIDSLAVGVASSRRWATGVPGALRSPTFTIEHDSIDVVAAGNESVIRIIIDNFQLIRYPIHGGLDQEVDSPALTTYRFDVGMWKGRKAYIELLAGRYEKKGNHINDNHRLVTRDASYIEAAYAVAYTGTLPDMTTRDTMSPDPADAALRQAVEVWAAGRADAGQAAVLDEALRRGRLNPSLDAVAPLLAQIREIEARRDSVVYFMGVTDGDAVSSAVFERGNYKTPTGEPVPHRFMTALDPGGTPFTETASGRLELAHAIADPANPLTARVMVNRLWHHVFGRGIVETVDNFGAQGALPTHPALLDYLALRFVEQGWSVKAMLREMVLSQMFRQSTQASVQAAEVDPQNHLWHHYPVRRLEAEAIRDAVLAASGRLDTTMYGEPVPVHLTEFMKGRGRPPATGPLDGDGRRSVYIAVRRNFLWPMMLAFDMPIPFSTFGKRNSSNVPAQSLTMLNDPFVAQQAEVWADTLAARRDLDAEAKIEYIYLTALSRRPTEEETANALQFLETEARRYDLPAETAMDDPRPWAAYCHVVFNLKEFIYLV